MLDCFKKVRESAQTKKRAAAQEEYEDEQAREEIIPTQSNASRQIRNTRELNVEGHTIVIYILDIGNVGYRHPLANEWLWNLQHLKKLAVIYEPSLNDLCMKISANLPPDRKIREIIGAIESLDNNGVPPDTAWIQSDDDLDAFLRITKAKPIRLIAILHKLAADGVNTPPPSEIYANNYYFGITQFDGPEY